MHPGGDGGFGGGGGSAGGGAGIGAFYPWITPGGRGGFGGGGGGGGDVVHEGVGGPARGGFSAGDGSFHVDEWQGGGGLGAGGLVFVNRGASFKAIDPIFSGSDFTVVGGAAGGSGAEAGQGIGPGFFLGGDVTIEVSGGNTVTLPAIADFLAGGDDPEIAGGLIKSGAGTLVLPTANSYVGGTTLSAGVLSVSADNQLGAAAGGLRFNGGTLQVSGTTYATTTRAIDYDSGGFDIVEASHSFVVSQALTGAGSLRKEGPGTLVLSGKVSYAGATDIDAGTLQLDNGLGGGGGTVTVASGATLLAKGMVSRPMAGAGTIIANNAALVLGDLGHANGFNINGAVNAGGTLSIGGNQALLLSQGRAVLGVQTTLATGGSINSLNGIQLGEATSLDATKVLTATGPATIQGSFINNGTVNGPTGAGQNLVLMNLVSGAGSFTGNVLFQGGYAPGNSPASVTLQNVTFASGHVLTLEIGGTQQGETYDHLNITGLAQLDGSLHVTFADGFAPSVGDRFDLLDGKTKGRFSRLVLPSLEPDMVWDTTRFEATGMLTVVSR